MKRIIYQAKYADLWQIRSVMSTMSLMFIVQTMWVK